MFQLIVVDEVLTPGVELQAAYDAMDEEQKQRDENNKE